MSDELWVLKYANGNYVGRYSWGTTALLAKAIADGAGHADLRDALLEAIQSKHYMYPVKVRLASGPSEWVET